MKASHECAKCANGSPLVLEEASAEFTIGSKLLKRRVGYWVRGCWY